MSGPTNLIRRIPGYWAAGFAAALAVFGLAAFGAYTEPVAPELPEPEVRAEETGGSGESRPRPVLPDLTLTIPAELYVQRDDESGIRRLRFSTTIRNHGPGPLEVQGMHDVSAETTEVIQIVLLGDGTKEERPVGRFVFHPDHDHWHTEDFIIFELLSPAEEVLATTGKMSFCLRDLFAFHPEPEPKTFEGCDRETQGISRGWEDTYEAIVRNQYLDIESLPDGQYVLRATVDPEGRFLEESEENNTTSFSFELAGDTVLILGG
jgi:hypothetical protein